MGELLSLVDSALLEASRAQEKKLGSDTHIVFAGAGPANLACGLEILRLMGGNAPRMTFLDTRDYTKEDGWENCKGCAARVLGETVDLLRREFDPAGEFFRVNGDEIAVCERGKYTNDGEVRFLAANSIKSIALHLPGEMGGISPVVHLDPADWGAMTFRNAGARALWPDTTNHGAHKRKEIGLNPTLLKLLQHNAGKLGVADRVQFIQGTVSRVDLTGDRPLLEYLDEEKTQKTIIANLVVSGMGVNGGRIPVERIDREDIVQATPQTVSSRVMEIAVSPSRALEIYGKDLDRGQIFIFDSIGVGKYVQYAMLLPQWVTGKSGRKNPVVTLAMIARDVKKYAGPVTVSKLFQQFAEVRNLLAPYLPVPSDSEIDFDTMNTFASCSCAPNIPVGAISLADTYADNFIVTGEQGGLPRWLKNGIGTAILGGIATAMGFVEKGYGWDALGVIARKNYGMYHSDNEAGSELLTWLDELVIQNPILSKAVYAFTTLFEQHLPSDMQVILKAMKDLMIGRISYGQISKELFSNGGHGTIYSRGMSEMIKLIAILFRHPAPKELS